MSLDFRSPDEKRSVARSTRRASIKAGAIGLMGGFGIDQLAAMENKPPGGGSKSVIYIFLSGGLAQHESFDMKPDAPSDIRGEFRPIPTNTPGIHVCEHLPELARRSHLWSLCRTISHGSNEHSDGHYIMMTGRTDLPPGFDRTRPQESDWPSIAALAGRMLPRSGALPPALVLPEKMVHRTGRTIPGQFGGLLGRHHDPFFIEASPFNASGYGAFPRYHFHHERGFQERKDLNFRTFSLDLPSSVDFDRFNDRLRLRSILDGQQDHLEKTAAAQGVDRYREMAVDLLSNNETRAAFDVHGADGKTQDRYGRNAFGWSLLLARQLVEAGVRLVQVNLGNNETWDTHQAAFPNLRDYLFPPADRAVAALLDDLSGRGLLDDTLVVMASEFGRTPRVFTLRGKKLPGRDHWGAVQSVLLAGGGIHGGGVLGKTDKMGGYPESDGRRAEDLAATIYHALGIPRGTNWHDVTGRPMPLYHGEPLSELFG